MPRVDLNYQYLLRKFFAAPKSVPRVHLRKTFPFFDNLLNLTWAHAVCKDDANSPKSSGAVDSKPDFDPAAYPSTSDRVEVHS